MLKQKKILQILGAAFLLAVLWAVFFIVQTIYSRKISNHELYIPSDATSVIKIDGEQVIKLFIQEVILEKRLGKSIQEYATSGDTTESLGMDYLSTVYIFTVEKDAKELMGFLINLNDDEQFKKAMSSNPEMGSGFSAKDGVGMMLFDFGDDLLTHKRLNSIADSCISKKSGFDLTRLSHSTENTQVAYWRANYSLDFGKKSFDDLRMSLSLKKNNLAISGTAEFKSSARKVYPVLKKDDLHFQSQFIPNGVNRFWQRNMESVGFSFPKLTYVSGNYHYVEPSPIKEFTVLPHFDGIYAFEENFRIRIPLLALAASGKISSLNLKSFDLGGKKIYYEQIDSKTIYLGQSQYNPEANAQNVLLEVEGDLKQFLKIKNGGMLERLLNFSSEYNTVKHFLSGVTSSDIRIKDTGRRTNVDFIGELTFKDDVSALNETIRLLIELELFD